ncbi:hypothetical protein [Dokdonia sp.]|uniref:hypothetical protein n=1 Tax=Dokdonia sp. TaxID=2024995 RepID=UPI003263FBD1
MKHLYPIYILIIISIFACSQSPEDALQHLSGYWEIADVTFTDGSKKEFSISQNIDFFEVKKDQTGIRTKVQPDINGHFTTSKSVENIDIKTVNDTLTLKYATAYDTWQEKVISATKEQLVLLTKNGNVYTYRRYKPLIINE